MNASPGMRDDDRVEETAEPRRGPGVGFAAGEDRAAGPAAHAGAEQPEDPAAHTGPDQPEDPAAHAGPDQPEDPAAHAGPDQPEDRPAGEDPDVLIVASEQAAAETVPDPVPEPAGMEQAVVPEPSGAFSPQPVADAARPGAGSGDPLATDSAVTDPDQRWHEIQIMFVDDPLGSVERAADLASDLVGGLISLLEERERSLRAAWQGTEADTEQLRTSLRTYRALVHQVAEFSRPP